MAVTLAALPVGQAGTLLTASTAPALARRLAELGLRAGTSVTAIHRTAGGGRLVDVAGSRIALSRELAETIEVAPE